MKRHEIKSRPLADTVIAGLEPASKEYRELHTDGVYLRVKPDGQKSWQLRYKKADGKWSWLGLGPYGKAPHQLTGKQAREKAAAIKASAVDSGDLLQSKRAKLTEERERQKNTFEHLATEWLTGKAKGWTGRTAGNSTRALQNHVFPKFGKRPYTGILPMEWMELLRDMAATVPDQAGRVRTLCRDIYGLALVTGRATMNPLDGLEKYMESGKKENYRHVPIAEFPALVRAIRAYPNAPDVCIGLQLLAMLACRPSELREAAWAEFDLDNALWSIPAERMKKRRDHLVPLPRQAVDLLRKLHYLTGAYPLLFPGRSDATKARSNMTFLMALRRLGYEHRQTAHGFRHLASTILNDHGFDENHVEAQLSHVKDGVAGTYNKAKYLEQRKVMMQWYADHLDSLAGANVVSIKQA